jgi:hypothetical protein
MAKRLIHACHLKRNVMDTLIVEVEKMKKVVLESRVVWISSDALTVHVVLTQL